MRVAAAIAVAAAVCPLACDRPAGRASSRTPTARDEAATATADAFVSAEGAGSTRDEAVAAAREALLDAVLGDARWAALTGLPTGHLDATDTVPAGADGTLRVRIGLSRVETAALMAAFEASAPVVTGPAAWRDVLYAFLDAHVAAQACDQRRRLFSATCEAGDTADVDDALAQLTTEVQLSPPFPDGVPEDAEGRPLRPASVYVLWRGLPIADVPVIATGDAAGELRATSDARGVAIVAPTDSAAWSTLAVSVDSEALLGPRHGAWPDRPVDLKKRRVDARRWAVISVQDDTELASTLQVRMKQHGAPTPVAVAPEVGRDIAAARDDARLHLVTALADASSGRIDVILVVDADSRFAGRMGSSKSWAEASGHVRIHDAWTGRVIATLDETATASGVGEERAIQAARDKLARALADRVLAVPELGLAH